MSFQGKIYTTGSATFSQVHVLIKNEAEKVLMINKASQSQSALDH